jgi:hypothetical protein
MLIFFYTFSAIIRMHDIAFMYSKFCMHSHDALVHHASAPYPDEFLHTGRIHLQSPLDHIPPVLLFPQPPKISGNRVTVITAA